MESEPLNQNEDSGADAATEGAFEQASVSRRTRGSNAAAAQSAAQRVNAPVAQVEAKETTAEEEFQKQKHEPHYKIVIPSTGNENELKRVPVGVNGVVYTILRDEEVVVPIAVLHNLDIALETRYRQKKEASGATTQIPYKVKSFPYQIIEGPLAPTPITNRSLADLTAVQE